MTNEQKRLQNKLNQRKYRHKKLLGYVPKSGGRRGRPREPGTYRNRRSELLRDRAERSDQAKSPAESVQNWSSIDTARLQAQIASCESTLLQRWRTVPRSQPRRSKHARRLSERRTSVQ